MQVIETINCKQLSANRQPNEYQFWKITLLMNAIFLCKLISQPNVICSTIKGYYKHYNLNEKNSIQ